MGEKEYTQCKKKCDADCAKKHKQKKRPAAAVSGGTGGGSSSSSSGAGTGPGSGQYRGKGAAVLAKLASANNKRQRTSGGTGGAGGPRVVPSSSASSSSSGRGGRGGQGRKMGRPRTSANPRAERPKKAGWNRRTGRTVYRTKEGKLIEWIYPDGKDGGRIQQPVHHADLLTSKPDAKELRRLRDSNAAMVSTRRPGASTSSSRASVASSSTNSSSPVSSHVTAPEGFSTAPWLPNKDGKGQGVAQMYIRASYNALRRKKGAKAILGAQELQVEIFRRGKVRVRIDLIRSTIKEEHGVTLS